MAAISRIVPGLFAVVLSGLVFKDKVNVGTTMESKDNVDAAKAAVLKKQFEEAEAPQAEQPEVQEPVTQEEDLDAHIARLQMAKRTKDIKGSARLLAAFPFCKSDFYKLHVTMGQETHESLCRLRTY